MNFEYERSFSAKSIDKYIEYCNQNGYEKTSEVLQNRIVFENQTNKKLIARITKEKILDKETIAFDCKNVLQKDGNLNQSLESTPLNITENDLPAILSMMEVMDFKQSADNIRKRYVYQKDKVCFEIDEYIRPKMNVVAIEGNKEDVERIYAELTTD